jgi:hypothetical protein
VCYIAHCDADTPFLQALPPYYRHNVYILTMAHFDPITASYTLDAFKACQALHASSNIEFIVVKRSGHHRTDLEEQHTVFNKVHSPPVHVPNMPHPKEPTACRVVTAVVKPIPPARLGNMLRSGFKPQYKAAHFENYDKMYRTGTWSPPVLRADLPATSIILPNRYVHFVKRTEVSNIFELQVCTCANGSSMVEGMYCYQSFAHVASIDSIRTSIALGAAQKKTAHTLDVSHEFQTSIVFQGSKCT